MKQNPPYKPIKQKPYCCVPASIAMILNRRGINCGSQDEIGYFLGLIVPREKTSLFKKVRTGKKPGAGYGTQVSKKQYSINHYFQKNNIPLKERYFPPEKIGNIKKFIISNIRKNNDIIVCFNNKKLHGKGDWGHVSLVQEITNEDVFLIDPTKFKIKVKLSKLIEAMKYHGKKNRGGVWLISEK